MSSFFRRLRARLKYRHFAAELKDELDVHRAMAEDEWRASGETPGDVRRRAARQLGNVTLARESARGIWLAPWLESVWQDVRYAVQTLAIHRGFMLTATAMLALGIGITTAMFTIVDALVFRPAPFREPDRLALVLMGNDRGVRNSAVPAAVAKAWRESAAFEVVESARPWSAVLAAGDTIVERGMAAVTPGVFDMLGGVRPLHGRLFHATEGQAGQADRVLISETIWRTLYGADPAIIGQPITVDGEPLTVVGVLASDFRFPEATTLLWRPTDLNHQPAELARPYVRFASGIPRDDALRMATEAARAVDARARQTNALALASPVAGLSDVYSTRAVPLLAGGVGLVFLVLCANVSSLLLARLTTRRREFSMRAALGASRARLMRQALVESAALGALGVAGGLGVAWTLVSVARAFLPEPLLQQTLNPLNIDGRTLLASSIAGLAAMTAAGLLPAWLSTRVDAGESLRVSDRSGTEPRSARVLTRTLLVTEVALACTLLVAAALLTRSFLNLAHADRGLDTTGVTTARLALPAVEGDPEHAVTIRDALARSIENDLRHLPGVRHLAWSYGIPPEGGFQNDGTWISDEPGATAASMELNHYVVSPEFFSVYGIAILAGRSFTTSDGSRDVVVGERFARALWQGVDPVGRTFHRQAVQESTAQPALPATYRVVGVARELHYPSIEGNSGLDGPEIYLPYTPAPTPMISLRCEPTCDTAVIRHRLASTHPAVRVQQARIAADRYAREVVRPRASAVLAVTFAAIAVAAAAGGLLSVLSYVVSRRRREFGIRIALGASPGQIRRVVLRDGLIVAVSGLAIGSIAAATLARALASLQYGVTSFDPVSWSIVFGVIVATAIVASWGPARSAARVDPIVLLREE